MADRVRVCAVAEVPDGTARRVDVGGHRLAVANVAGRFYVIGDRCSHADYSLAEGELDAGDLTVECPKHGSTFSLLTGEPESFPATMPVPVYQVEIDGDDVMVAL